MGRTKKVGIAGKYGPRYGFTLRRRAAEVEARARQWYECPNCRAPKLKRVGTAIWECRRCGVKLAGRAYVPGERRK
jgi:large subunit ribosomal protein L37Ae